MGKKTFLIITILVVLCVLVGCRSLKTGVSTDGSTSVEKVIGSLGEAFENETGITVTYNPTGSTTGIKAVSDGRCDIGLSSRELKEEEKAMGLKATVLAYDGIAVIVNKENPVEDLDVGTIARVFKGEIKNWRELGGKDLEIVCIGREAGSGTRDGFESATDTNNKCKYRQELTSTGDIITTVSSNPNAIGYVSLASVKESVKTIAVDGVAPSETSIKNGEYKIKRPFIAVTKEGTALTENTQRFFDYISSESAKKIILSAGVVPAN